MALTGGVTRRRDIPHEPGEWITFRVLNRTQLLDAQEARLKRAQRISRESFDRVGREMFQILLDHETQQTQQPAHQAAVAAPTPDDAVPTIPVSPLEQVYDGTTLLNLGIIEWSYGAPVSPETIEQLDPVTAAWAMGVIIGIYTMSTPEAEAERKNGVTPSFAH